MVGVTGRKFDFAQKLLLGPRTEGVEVGALVGVLVGDLVGTLDGTLDGALDGEVLGSSAKVA